MGIERFFNQTLTQNRKAAAPVSGVAAWVLVTTFKGCVFPTGLDPASASSEYIKLKITHGMYCPASIVINKGDQIVNGTLKYIVKVVPDWVKFKGALLSEEN